MNGLKASAAELGKIMAGRGEPAGKVDLMVCPPATLVATFAAAARGSRVAIGGQDCHAEPSGAFTGDISAEMLADAGATRRDRRPFRAAHLSPGDRRARCAPRRRPPGAPG